MRGCTHLCSMMAQVAQAAGKHAVTTGGTEAVVTAVATPADSQTETFAPSSELTTTSQSARELLGRFGSFLDTMEQLSSDDDEGGCDHGDRSGRHNSVNGGDGSGE